MSGLKKNSSAAPAGAESPVVSRLMKKSPATTSRTSGSKFQVQVDKESSYCEFQDVLDLLQSKGSQVSKQELRDALKGLGYSPKDEDLEEMIEGGCETDSVDISYFLDLMARRMKDDDPTAKLREAFGNFDVDKSGSISATELRNVLKTMGQSLTDKDVDRMIQLADVDGDGEVNFEEFVNMIMPTFTSFKKLI